MYRPKTFDEFIGNEQVKERLKMYIKVCKQDKSILPHSIFYGPAGTGKTSLSNIIANESSGSLFSMTGASIRTQEELFNIMRNIKAEQKKNAVFLFIDEIHELPKASLPEAVWLPLIEEFKLFHNLFDLLPAPRARGKIQIVEFKLSPFTIIGATTNPEGLSKPLRDRFPICCEMQDYNLLEMSAIAGQYLEKISFKIEVKALQEMSARSRFNPRTINSFCELCVLRAKSKQEKCITYATLREEMKAQRIDNLGLGQRDREMLIILAQHREGIGISRIANIMLTKSKALTEMHENFLAKINLITMGKKGREITKKGMKHITSFYF